jgi:hypothetical protein
LLDLLDAPRPGFAVDYYSGTTPAFLLTPLFLQAAVKATCNSFIFYSTPLAHSQWSIRLRRSGKLFF